MNKKIYGFLLVATALFSVGTFESCKDTNTDLYNEVLIKETQHYNELKNRIEALEKSLCSVDCEALQSEVAALKAEIAALKETINTATAEQLDAVIKRVDALEAKNTDLLAKYESLQNQINDLASQAKGITVQSVYTPAFGSFNTPVGLSSNVLLGYYGEAKTAIDFNGTIVGGDIVSGNLGTLYLSVDPLNVDFSGVDVNLVTSKGNKVGVALTPLQKSEHEILLGYTRANNYLYETTATFTNKDDVQHVTLDIQGFKDAVKDLLTINDGVDFSKIAELVFKTVNQQLTGNAVEIKQGENAVISKYEICAAAVEPLTMTTFDALSNIDPSVISNKIGSGANALVKRIQNALIQKFGSQLVSFDIPSIQLGLDKDIVVTIPAGAIQISVEGTIGSNSDPIDITIPKEDFNEMFDAAAGDINKLIVEVQNYITKVNNAWTEITTGSSSAIVDKALESLVNKTISVVERLSKAANPAVYVVDGNKVKRLSTIEAAPTILESAEVELLPTSNTLELIVPFYKKYIKADGASIVLNGADVNGEVFDGTVMKVNMNVSSSKVVKLVYEVVDYAGKPAQREYYVKVK